MNKLEAGIFLIICIAFAVYVMSKRTETSKLQLQIDTMNIQLIECQQTAEEAQAKALAAEQQALKQARIAQEALMEAQRQYELAMKNK